MSLVVEKGMLHYPANRVVSLLLLIERLPAPEEHAPVTCGMTGRVCKCGAEDEAKTHCLCLITRNSALLSSYSYFVLLGSCSSWLQLFRS